MPAKKKENPEVKDEATETTEVNQNNEGAAQPKNTPEEKKDEGQENKFEETAAKEKATDDSQGEENGEGAKEDQKEKADGEPQTEEAANMELLEAKAQLAALKSGISVNVVEDAVCLAIHEAKKNGTVDENSIAEALKAVMDRHPEWKSEQETAQTGFRVGAENTQQASSANDEISKIFGNK